jgi:hypothetical protein
MLKPRQSEKLWLGINAATNIWTILKKGLTKKATILTPRPFKGIWNITLKKRLSRIKTECNQCDSWQLAFLDQRDSLPFLFGIYVLNRESGESWSPILGRYTYPFFVQKGKTVILTPQFQDLKVEYDLKHRNLIYPLQALKKGNPALSLLPYDALKNILDPITVKRVFRRRAPNSHYMATCSATEKVEKVFYQDKSESSQKFIKETFKNMNKFVYYGRQRIEEYKNWYMINRNYLRWYTKKYPKSAKSTTSLFYDLSRIAYYYAEALGKMKTPRYCKLLTDKVVRLADAKDDAETKETQCKQLGRQIRTIGNAQDELLAMLHYTTKAFRQHITLLSLTNNPPRQQNFLLKMRTETAKILNNAIPMEGKP